MTNLRPYQYQIGNLIFGRHTQFPVEKVDVQTYNVNAQDFQMIRSDETRMGIDTLTAGPIIFTMGVKDNYPINRMMELTGGHLPDDLEARHAQMLAALQREWKAEEIKSQWGELKPLRFGHFDGSVRRIYGRPRKFTYTTKTPKSQFHRVSAEFARSDTKAYSDLETFQELTRSADPVYVSQDGDTDTWLRILVVGPADHPIITIGEMEINVNLLIPVGLTLEINSYPWQRRVVDSDGYNWRTKLIGRSPYLDKMSMPYGQAIPMRFTTSDANTFYEIPGTSFFGQAPTILERFHLNSRWTYITGPIWVFYGFLNGQWVQGGLTRGAAVYNHKQFITNQQYIEFEVLSANNGRSAMLLNCTPTMSNYAGIVADCEPFGPDYIKIITGSGTTSTVRATWEVDNGLFGLIGFIPGDKVALRYDPFEGDGTYFAYYNGEMVASWEDTTGVVGTGSSNRSMALMTNLDNNVLLPGPFLTNLLCYDYYFPGQDPGEGEFPDPTASKVYVLWRDAYNVV